MTIQVDGKNLPLMRDPTYFEDTWNMDIDQLPVLIGNEKKNNNKLIKISLKQYLKNFNKYITASIIDDNLKDKSMNLLADNMDTKAVVSAQACMVPTTINTAKNNFGIQLYTHETQLQNPSSLCVISTPQGTSSQVIEGMLPRQ